MIVPAYPGCVVPRIEYNQTCFAAVLIFNALHCICFIKPGWSCLELSFCIVLLLKQQMLLGVSKVVRMSFNASWKFLRLGNSSWHFLEVNFCSRDFGGVLTFAHIRSSSSLEIRTPTTPWAGTVIVFFVLGLSCIYFVCLFVCLFDSVTR